MTLRMAEKEHWRERIGKRIDQRIETLVAKGDPTLLERVSKDSRERALESLGIAEHQREIEEIEKQPEKLVRRTRRLQAEQRAVVNGTSVEDELERNDYYARSDHDVTSAVKRRAKALEADILAESDLGKQVLSLRQEKENLLDTVWLATSCSQIKELWLQVNQLLSASPTALEVKALEIAPVEPD